MKLVYENAKEFDSLLRRVAVVLTEANLVVGLEGEGVRVRDLDPARVALVELQMGSELFEVYEVEEPLTIGLSLDAITAITKRAKKGDQVELQYTPGEQLKIIFFGQARKRMFKLLTFELEEHQVPSSDPTFEARFLVDAAQLREFIKDAEVIDTNYGSGTIFLADGLEGERSFTVRVDSDTRTYVGSLEEGDEWIEFYTQPTLEQAAYTIRYLKEMVHTQLDEKVLVEFSSDMPLRLSYSFAGSGSLSYLLAPRIEED